ncbi:MAG: SGNH/GDSL hydrolase family protein, partial [Anaerolineae bacterium]|nr:SGNH/GDSL hydrolase family protein [Anaerolineae bacterium]
MVNRKTQFLKFILLISSTFLIISIAANAILYKELMKYYKLLYAAELDPLGLSYFQDATNQKTSDKPVIVFYGDSRAEHWIPPQADDFTFINRGIGNQTSAQVLLRFEKHIQPLQPDAIIVQVCINDLKTIPLFPERKDEIITVCKTNIESIVQKSLELNSAVILTTVFPTSGNVPLARRLVWSDEVYKAIDDVNDFILNYTADNVIIFDTA